jgi:putative membrane protein
MIGGYSMMGGMGWLGMLLVGVFWIVVIALVIWGVVNLLHIQQTTSEPDAQETLKRRYARGEISREEFEQARIALR